VSELLFSLLLSMIGFLMGRAAKTNKAIKEMMAIRNLVFVIMTEDGKIGRRFIFKDGKYSTDNVLKDYNMAMVWKNPEIAFKTLAFGGETGLQDAMNNWNMRLAGDSGFFNFFGVLLLVSMGKMKR
jgi:hypothetical protein